MEDSRRINMMKKLNCIQEIILVEPLSSHDEKEPLSIATTTRSRTRRVQFNGQPTRRQLDKSSRAMKVPRQERLIVSGNSR